MEQLDHFINEGYGWYCIECQRDRARAAEDGRSMFLREGEAETKTAEMAGKAQWTDKARRALICTTCGISEVVDKS